MNKLLQHLVAILCVILIVIGIVSKKKLNAYLSNAMKQSTSIESSTSVEARIDSLYNYKNNGKQFTHTFLEFGSVGCVACKKMEGTMKEIRERNSEVNVVFYNITKFENQNLIKTYGISVIPTQVVLNKQGKEIYRHSGYITPEELLTHFN